MASLVGHLETENGLEEEDALLLMHYLKTDEQIRKFGDWARQRLENGRLNATPVEICRAATKIYRGLM